MSFKAPNYIMYHINSTFLYWISFFLLDYWKWRKKPTCTFFLEFTYWLFCTHSYRREIIGHTYFFFLFLCLLFFVRYNLIRRITILYMGYVCVWLASRLDESSLSSWINSFPLAILVNVILVVYNSFIFITYSQVHV